MSAWEIEVPGQHSGTDYKCAACGCDYGTRTIGCRTCARRHGWRRRKSRQLAPVVAPTKAWWEAA